jgi:Outer membrane protein beta-barrel domain
MKERAMMSKGIGHKTEATSLAGQIGELRIVHRFIVKRVHVLCAGLYVTFLLVVLVNLSFAQDENHFTLNVGGGPTTVNGRDAGRLDHGGNFQVGAGYNFNRFFGITENFIFNELEITRAQLLRLNVPNGGARVYSFTLDPTLRLPLGQNWNVYVLAGGGYLRRTVQFTQPTTAVTVVFDSWWGCIGPALIPVNQVLGSVTSNAGAYDVGAGVNVPLPVPRLHLIVESRYLPRLYREEQHDHCSDSRWHSLLEEISWDAFSTQSL